MSELRIEDVPKVYMAVRDDGGTSLICTDRKAVAKEVRELKRDTGDNWFVVELVPERFVEQGEPNE